MKKPFYKKWWFITIIALLVLAIIGNSLGEPTNNSAANEPVSKNIAAANENEVEQKADEKKAKSEADEKVAAEQVAKEEAEAKLKAVENEQKIKDEANALESKKKAEQSIKENKLEYSIEEERIGGSIWYVTLSTPLTKEKDLRKLVELTKDLADAKDEKIDSIFVKINIKDSLAKSYAADGKVALSDIGLAQTGLKKVNKYEFNYNVREEHLTSKDDLKQSSEKYSARDALKAFQNAGLPTTDSRDNSHNCVKLECTTLITTEDVSIYEWPSVEKAQEVHAKSFGDAQVGTIIIRMNNNALDVQEYIAVLEKVINK